LAIEVNRATERETSLNEKINDVKTDLNNFEIETANNFTTINSKIEEAAIIKWIYNK